MNNTVMNNTTINFNIYSKKITFFFPITSFTLSRYYSDNSLKYPIIIYNNGDLDKHIAITQNKKKAGVYRWVNKINNKTYIGSSINLGRRLAEYYSYNRISSAKRKFPIHIALLKYGYSNFKLEILEYCNVSDLVLREQYFINTLNPNYNVLTVAGSSLGFKHSDVTKELFSLSRLGVKRVDYAKKVNHISDETRYKLSVKSYNAIPVVLTNVETGKVIEFSSKSKAAEFLNVSQATIKKYILNNKMIKGYNLVLKYNNFI